MELAHTNARCDSYAAGLLAEVPDNYRDITLFFI